MTTIASQITSLAVVYSTVYSDADQRKHQSSASLAFVWGIHRDRWIPHTKGQLRRKCFHLMTSSWNARPKNGGLFNSLRSRDAYMRQLINHHWFRLWLVAWPVPSHYLNQRWNIVNWTLGNKLQWNPNRNSDHFIQENAFENVVCETAAILSRPKCVKPPLKLEHGWLITSHRKPWMWLLIHKLTYSYISGEIFVCGTVFTNLSWAHNWHIFFYPSKSNVSYI